MLRQGGSGWGQLRYRVLGLLLRLGDLRFRYILHLGLHRPRHRLVGGGYQHLAPGAAGAGRAALQDGTGDSPGGQARLSMQQRAFAGRTQSPPCAPPAPLRASTPHTLTTQKNRACMLSLLSRHASGVAPPSTPPYLVFCATRWPGGGGAPGGALASGGHRVCWRASTGESWRRLLCAKGVYVSCRETVRLKRLTLGEGRRKSRLSVCACASRSLSCNAQRTAHRRQLAEDDLHQRRRATTVLVPGTGTSCWRAVIHLLYGGRVNERTKLQSCDEPEIINRPRLS